MENEKKQVNEQSLINVYLKTLEIPEDFNGGDFHVSEVLRLNNKEYVDLEVLPFMKGESHIKIDFFKSDNIDYDKVDFYLVSPVDNNIGNFIEYGDYYFHKYQHTIFNYLRWDSSYSLITTKNDNSNFKILATTNNDISSLPKIPESYRKFLVDSFKSGVKINRVLVEVYTGDISLFRNKYHFKINDKKEVNIRSTIKDTYTFQEHLDEVTRICNLFLKEKDKISSFRGNYELQDWIYKNI